MEGIRWNLVIELLGRQLPKEFSDLAVTLVCTQVVQRQQMARMTIFRILYQ